MQTGLYIGVWAQAHSRRYKRRLRHQERWRQCCRFQANWRRALRTLQPQRHDWPLRKWHLPCRCQVRRVHPPRSRRLPARPQRFLRCARDLPRRAHSQQPARLSYHWGLGRRWRQLRDVKKSHQNWAVEENSLWQRYHRDLWGLRKFRIFRIHRQFWLPLHRSQHALKAS